MGFSTSRFLDRLDRVVRPFAVPSLPIILVMCQACAYIVCLLNPELTPRLLLNWDLVLAGEFWRLFTFMLVAPVGQPIFAIFYFYILYMMGNYLEHAWGSVRLCSYVYLGLASLVIAGLFVRTEMISGNYLYATLFLAFATLNPTFTFMIMFILPIQVKYLAWLQAAGYLYVFFSGGPGDKLMVAAALLNFLIFFSDVLSGRATGFHRRLTWQAKNSQRSKMVHVCEVCGVDSESNPDIDFRYCSQCDGSRAYCEQHLRNHEHVTEVPS